VSLADAVNIFVSGGVYPYHTPLAFLDMLQVSCSKSVSAPLVVPLDWYGKAEMKVQASASQASFVGMS